MLCIAVVAIFGVVAYAVSNLVGSSAEGPRAKVPLVEGLARDVAVANLKKVGLNAQIVNETNDKVPLNVVIKQNPEQNTSVDPANTTVILTVSTGAGSVTVPDVKNQLPDQAATALTSSGLTAGDTTSVDDPTVVKGHVVRTDPAADTPVTKGTTVRIFVASGKVDMPDLVGKTLNEATSVLGELHIALTKNPTPSDQPQDTVLSQDVQPGTKVDINSAVTLTVAIAQQPSPTPTPTTPATPTPDGQPSSTDPNQSPTPTP
jgi:serine/threonine-protein kinase